MLIWPSVCTALIFLCVALSSVIFETRFRHKNYTETHRRTMRDTIRRAMMACTQNCPFNALFELSKCHARIELVEAAYHDRETMIQELSVAGLEDAIDKIEHLSAVALSEVRAGKGEGFFKAIKPHMWDPSHDNGTTESK